MSAAQNDRNPQSKSATKPGRPSWTQRYGTKHRWERVADFPKGITAPKRVRLYRRTDHFILQWWDKGARKNLSIRVDGDLIAALIKAREIEERLEHFRSAPSCRRRLKHAELTAAFLADLNRRAEAVEIDPRTVDRYRSALKHYLNFTEQSEIESEFPSAGQVTRPFALAFAAWLRNRRVAPNGNATQRRPMQSASYVTDVVRGMFRWASEPDQGSLLPDGFRNPFAGKRHHSDVAARDLFGEPDITVGMAAEFLGACDAFQLPLFSLLAFYGLRASEPCYILHEDVGTEWLKVICRPQLGYFSKGRRDKRLPLVAPLDEWLTSAERTGGVLLVRRPVFDARERPSLLGASAADLEREFQSRCGRADPLTARHRAEIRDSLFRDAGGLRYDDVEREFGVIARQLKWPREATLKDLRHLFSTSMENAGMPLFYRRYLMGQSPGRSAIVNYTHLNELRQQFDRAVERALQPLVEAAARRGRELGLCGSSHSRAS